MDSTNHSQSNTPNPALTTLFHDIETSLQNTQLASRWYLLVLAALVTGPDPEHASHLYQHLISKPAYQSSPFRQSLVRRLREGLVKLISIIGVCKPISAILSIAKIERPEDRDLSCSRENWTNDAANHERGVGWMQKIYQRNIDDTLALFDAHRDFRWISTEITYGLYLSDRGVLDDVDTEVLVLVGIMVQNLGLETHWHIRGMRRLGVPKEDVESLFRSVKKMAEFMDVKVDRLPTVEEVEKDV